VVKNKLSTFVDSLCGVGVLRHHHKKSLKIRKIFYKPLDTGIEGVVCFQNPPKKNGWGTEPSRKARFPRYLANNPYR
jgi:hypothetical protein